MTFVRRGAQVSGGAVYTSPYAAQPDVDALDVHTQGWVNVKTHGAVGDGVADDTAAIQGAIDAASRAAVDSFEWNQGVGYVVFFPRGVYRVTDTLTVTANGVRLVGTGAGTTSIKMDATATTDAISFAPANQKIGVKGIWIYAFSSGGLPGKFRDGIVLGNSAGVGGASWFTLDDVKVSYADGYGFRIHRALDSKILNCGTRYTKTGLFIDADGSGVESTTLAIHGFTSSNATEHGVIVNKAYVVSFDQLTSEGAGSLGAATGAGIRVGPLAEVTLTSPYFENNAGWDIDTGYDATNYSVLTVVNPSARLSGTKASGYGFIRVGARTRTGALIGGYYTGYDATHKAVSIASGASNFHIIGVQANTDGTSVEYNSGALSGYNGLVLGWNGLGEGMIEGRYKFRVFGGPLVSASSAVPASGTWATGDIVINSSTSSSLVEAWRCTAGGTPGTWAQVYRQRWSRDQTGPTYGTTVTPNLDSGDVQVVTVTDGVAFTFANPTGTIVRGQQFTVRFHNASGGAMGAITWGGQYKLAAWTNPANGQNRSITFEWNTANWIEVSRTPADVPN